MKDENRAQALGRLLGELDHFDFFSPPYENDSAIVDDAVSALGPFMENPERHARHVAVILEYVQLTTATRAFQPLFRLYNLPFARKWLARRFTRSMLEPLRSRIQGARDEAIGTVEPGELRVDLLPVVSVVTKGDWKKQGRRLALVEMRGVVTPGAGMQLRAISHQLQVLSPTGCQFVDAIPSNEMETLGAHEVSISDRGKFVYSTTGEGKLAIGVSKGPIKVDASLGSTDSSSQEAEETIAEKISHAPQVARVISSAVGNVAMWRLLRTPTQLLLGTHKFSATVLIPSDAVVLNVAVSFGADVEGWGPTSIQRSYELPVPKA